MTRSFTRRFLLVPILALVAGCGGGDRPSPTEPGIEGVQLTPSTKQLTFLGETFQFAARVFRTNGGTVTGAQIEWSSSDPGIVTVTNAGLVTAVAPGAVTITAAYQGFSATADVVVSTPDCVSVVNLAPGESQVLSIGCAIELPAGAPGDRYRLAILNQEIASPSDLGSAVRVGVAPVATTGGSGAPAPGASVVLADRPAPRSEGSTRGRGPLRPDLAFDDDRQGARIGAALMRRTAGEHMVLYREVTELWDRLRPDVDGMLARLAERPLTTASLSATSPQRITYRENSTSACSVRPERPAFLVAENEHMAIYEDSVLGASPATWITEGQAQRLLDYYDEFGDEVIQSYFHGFPDIDGNGKVLAISAFTTSLSSGNRAAYVNGLDLFPREDCATSNQAELMYLNAAVIRSLDQDRDFALEIPIHEAKHIASFWQGLRRSTLAGDGRFHPSWFEEGSAEIASEVSGRKAWASIGGPGMTERVTADNIREFSVDANDEFHEEFSSTYARLIAAHRYLTSQPNGLMVTPFTAKEGSSIYGSGWTFLRWLGDAYGGAATARMGDADFFRALNDSLANPAPQGIADLTGKPFNRILEEFTTSVMLHMEAVEPAAGSYRLYDFVSSIEAFCYAADNPPCEGVTNPPPGSWPWPVTTKSDGTMAAPFALGTYNGQIGDTGIRIHEFRSDGTNTIQVAVEAEPPVRVIVVRLN